MSSTLNSTTATVLRLFRDYPLSTFTVLACFFGWTPFTLTALGLAEGTPSNIPPGVVVAALVVTACQGRQGLSSWARQLRRWRAKPGWYAFAFLAPISLVVLSVTVNHLFGAPLPTGEQLGDWPRAVGGGFVFMLVYVGLGEEAGWMAFAAPILLQRHSFFEAWARLSALRLVWHLPILLTGEVPWVFGILGMLSMQLIMLLMLHAARGPWTLAAVWHASLNATGGQFFFQMVSGPDNAHLGWLQAIAYTSAAVAFLLWVRHRRTTTPLSAQAARTAAPDMLYLAPSTTVPGSRHA